MGTYRRSILLAILVALLTAACGLEHSPTPRPGGSGAPIASAAPPVSSGLHPQLPIGFPVMTGAIGKPLPADDPGLIALWERDETGSSAYDFYVAALPAAGYPIVGLYPGGGVALIRFRAQGEIWQVVARAAANGGVAIEVRLDRP